LRERGPLDLDEISRPDALDPLRATIQAARAKAVFTFELAKRMEGTRVTANTFHPGLVRSNLARNLPWYLRLPVSMFMSLVGTDCMAGVHLAASPDVEEVSGRFFVGRNAVSFNPSYDLAVVGKRLWDLSGRVTGIG
jgi:hypothetical protein